MQIFDNQENEVGYGCRMLDSVVTARRYTTVY